MKSPMFVAVLSSLAITLPLATRSIAQSQFPSDLQVVTPELHARVTDITTGPGAGFFNAHPWQFKVSKDGNGYIYSGKNIETDRGIRLAGGRVTKAQGKHVYKWNNAGTIYQVTWRVADPMYARLQVFDRQGKALLNKLMWTPIGN
jgi:hypothetical protein